MTVYLFGIFAWLLILARFAVYALRKAERSRARKAVTERPIVEPATVGQNDRLSVEGDVDPRIAAIIEAIPRRRSRRSA